MGYTDRRGVSVYTISIICLISWPIFGSVIRFLGDPDPELEIKVGQITVPVYREAELTVGDPAVIHHLYLTGAGIRAKRILFSKVNVYTAANYIDNPPISQDQPLDTLQNTKAKAMYLTALRDLTADQIRSSFEEALDVNGVDLTEPSMADLIAELTFDLPIESNGTIVGYTNYEGDHVLIEAPDREIYKVGPDLSFNFWRVWFGIPVDEGMARLKEKLVKIRGRAGF